jgi:hypothetical protein
VKDEGIDYGIDYDWTDASTCSCCRCDYTIPVRDFFAGRGQKGGAQ